MWAWSLADGTGVGFVDVEQGWTLNHEDLAAANITLISGLNQAYTGHGTAVLGEVVGVDNHLGVIGIAPGVSARVVSQYRTASNYQTGAAILSALSQMSAGDVMLLEAQTTYSTMPGYLPVEVEDAVFTAILTATQAGVIVIEAGGNGGNNLDAFQDVNGRKVLNRSSPDFRESGAIIVGAASSAASHGRLSFSNFGSPIDCYAWGENIQTTGDGWTGNLIIPTGGWRYFRSDANRHRCRRRIAILGAGASSAVCAARHQGCSVRPRAEHDERQSGVRPYRCDAKL